MNAVGLNQLKMVDEENVQESLKNPKSTESLKNPKSQENQAPIDGKRVNVKDIVIVEGNK
jgi:hypothetical protein